jgi:hypothetical protein
MKSLALVDTENIFCLTKVFEASFEVPFFNLSRVDPIQFHFNLLPLSLRQFLIAS